MKWGFAAAPLSPAEHRPSSGRFILLPLPRHIPPGYPPQLQQHQSRLLPSGRARGAPLRAGGSIPREAAPERFRGAQREKRDPLPAGSRRGAGKGTEPLSALPSVPGVTLAEHRRARFHQPREQVAAGTSRLQEDPTPRLAEPVGVRGDRMGTGCPQHPPVPMMAHARPRQLLGQGMVSLPIKPLLSPGPVRGGETPVAGWWIPQALPSPAFCIPTAPFPRRTAVPGHNGPFLPRHRRRLRSLGPFPGAEPPRWQLRRKNSSQ